MINIGKINKLTILRETTSGLFLGDNSGEDVLLPKKHMPRSFNIGDKIDVFIYLDKENRKIASTQKPLIQLNGFAKLRVTNITKFGAFLDWGMDKELFVPLGEQRDQLFRGEQSFFTLRFDNRSGRLFASNKIERYLNNDDLDVNEKDQVDLRVFNETEIGFSVIINDKYRGMIYKNEIYKDIYLGDNLTGYIKKIREDNKIDISLQPIGYRNSTDPNADIILKLVKEANGFLPVTDKSAPEEIYDLFGISKKAFKKAIGTLYKQRIIEITSEGIKVL